jgi:hypothetical protein
VPVLTFFSRGRGGSGDDHVALDRAVRRVKDARALAGDDHPVALLEVCDTLGERRERQRVRAEVDLAVPIAHHQR